MNVLAKLVLKHQQETFLVLSSVVCLAVVYWTFSKQSKPTTAPSFSKSDHVSKPALMSSTKQDSNYFQNSELVFQFHVSGEKLYAQLKHVVRQICAQWQGAPDEDIQVKIISGGITNQLYRLCYGELSVLVRLYGECTEQYIDREVDNHAFAELSRCGFAPDFYGRFLNGRVEGWVPSRALEPEEMSQLEPVNFVGKIAREIGKMHTLAMSGSKDPVLFEKLGNFESLAKKAQFPNDLEKDALLSGLALDELSKELKWLQTELEKVTILDEQDSIKQKAFDFASEIVYCHNDALAGNILYNDEWEGVRLIDYEYGGYNYRGFDLANHFFEYCGFSSDVKDYPDKEKQVAFFMEYLTVASPELFGELAMSSDDALSVFCDTLYVAVNRYSLASHLFWGFWAVVQAPISKIDFDYLSYAKLRFEGYYFHKRQFFGV